MTTEEFCRILTAFADRSVTVGDDGLLDFYLQDTPIQASLTANATGSLTISENGHSIPALTWLRTRIAKLEFLAKQIVAIIEADEKFVEPSGNFEGGYERQGESADERRIENVPKETLNYIQDRPGDAACVLYFTSGAGEGKSTLIGQLALRQARAYLAKSTEWLIVPVELGGKSFTRLDDIVVGNMANRFRYNYLYFESFMELVRLGLVVPALDGFEEMFVAGTSDRSANSALGTFVRDMQARGSVIVAARTAYYEFQDMQSKATIFDTARGAPANYARIQLAPWNESEFVKCGELLGVQDPARIHRQLATRFGIHHPILARPVLARKILSSAKDLTPTEFKSFIDSIETEKQRYIHDFYGSLLKREAQSVWVYKDHNQSIKPILDEKEHFLLLAAIAQEMWSTSTEWMRADTLVELTELYVEEFGKNAQEKQQATKRIKDHAFLTSGTGGTQFSFVHVDTYHFFLGQAIGSILRDRNRDEARRLFRNGLIAPDALDYASQFLRREFTESTFYSVLILFANQLLRDEHGASFAKENLGAIIHHLLDLPVLRNQTLEDLVFPQSTLKERRLSDITFRNCRFQLTSLSGSTLKNCRFTDCTFDGLEDLRPEISEYSWLEDCIVTYASQNANRRVYRAGQIKSLLILAGFRVESTIVAEPIPHSDDEELRLVDRLLTIMMRTTHITSYRIQQKFGTRTHAFTHDVLPELLRTGVLVEVPYRGGGQQEKYTLGKDMDLIEHGIERSNGKFADFLAWIRVQK